MILASIVVFPILLATIWFFAQAQPRTDHAVALARYNTAIAIIAIAAVVPCTLYARAAAGRGEVDAAWPVLAVFGSVLAVEIVLVAGIAVRFIVFREAKRR